MLGIGICKKKSKLNLGLPADVFSPFNGQHLVLGTSTNPSPLSLNMTITYVYIISSRQFS